MTQSPTIAVNIRIGFAPSMPWSGNRWGRHVSETKIIKTCHDRPPHRARRDHLPKFGGGADGVDAGRGEGDGGTAAGGGAGVRGVGRGVGVGGGGAGGGAGAGWIRGRIPGRAGRAGRRPLPFCPPGLPMREPASFCSFFPFCRLAWLSARRCFPWQPREPPPLHPPPPPGGGGERAGRRPRRLSRGALYLPIR